MTTTVKNRKKTYLSPNFFNEREMIGIIRYTHRIIYIYHMLDIDLTFTKQTVSIKSLMARIKPSVFKIDPLKSCRYQYIIPSQIIEVLSKGNQFFFKKRLNTLLSSKSLPNNNEPVIIKNRGTPILLNT